MNLDELTKTTTLEGLLALVVGGGFVRMLDKFLSRRSDSFNEEQRIRKELRDELEVLKDDIDRLEKENELWRQRYWQEYEKGTRARLEISRLHAQIGISGSFDFE